MKLNQLKNKIKELNKYFINKNLLTYNLDTFYYYYIISKNNIILVQDNNNQLINFYTKKPVRNSKSLKYYIDTNNLKKIFSDYVIFNNFSNLLPKNKRKVIVKTFDNHYIFGIIKKDKNNLIIDIDNKSLILIDSISNNYEFSKWIYYNDFFKFIQDNV